MGPILGSGRYIQHPRLGRLWLPIGISDLLESHLLPLPLTKLLCVWWTYFHRYSENAFTLFFCLSYYLFYLLHLLSWCSLPQNIEKKISEDFLGFGSVLCNLSSCIIFLTMAQVQCLHLKLVNQIMSPQWKSL